MPILGVRLTPVEHKAFKLRCVDRELKMSDVVRRLVRDWLKEQERLDQKVRDIKEEGGG